MGKWLVRHVSEGFGQYNMMVLADIAEEMAKKVGMVHPKGEIVFVIEWKQALKALKKEFLSFTCKSEQNEYVCLSFEEGGMRVELITADNAQEAVKKCVDHQTNVVECYKRVI